MVNFLHIYGGSGLEPAAQIHSEVTAEIIERLHEQGTISKRSTLQFYDAKAGTFLNGRQWSYFPIQDTGQNKLLLHNLF